MKHVIAYQNADVLSYAEYGDRHGYPILVQHGLIASISDGYLFDRLIDAGHRIVCIARPGYGHSSAYPMAKIAEYGTIVSALVDHLALTQFDVLGLSSGAPYCYAIGHKMPDKARHIFIFSGTPALYDDQVLEHWPYPVKKNASIAEMAQVAREVFFAGVTAEDRLRDDIQDSMAHDCFGVAQDLRLRCRAWGFELSEMTVRVCMEHSRTDSDVPFVTAALTASLLPRCTLKEREGEHFSPESLDRFLQIMLCELRDSGAQAQRPPG